MDQPILIAVDLQYGFVNEHNRHIIPNVKALLTRFRKAGLPVVWTRFINSSLSPFERHLDWTRVGGPPETEILEELARSNEPVFDKRGYTAFTPSLRSHLEATGRETIVLCGIATEACVLKTALDAFEAGLRPVVVGDACASDLGPALHDAGILLLNNLIGRDQIIKTDDLSLLLPESIN